MKGQEHYRHWILATLIPRLRQAGGGGAGGGAAEEEVERGGLRGGVQAGSSYGRDRHLLSAGNGAYAVEGGMSPHSAPSSPASYYSSDSYHSR